jgi:hypothetical protein
MPYALEAQQRHSSSRRRRRDSQFSNVCENVPPPFTLKPCLGFLLALWALAFACSLLLGVGWLHVRAHMHHAMQGEDSFVNRLSQRRQAVRTRDLVAHTLRYDYTPRKLLSPSFSGALSHFVIGGDRLKVYAELAEKNEAAEPPQQQQQQQQQQAASKQ